MVRAAFFPQAQTQPTLEGRILPEDIAQLWRSKRTLVWGQPGVATRCLRTLTPRAGKRGRRCGGHQITISGSTVSFVDKMKKAFKNVPTFIRELVAPENSTARETQERLGNTFNQHVLKLDHDKSTALATLAAAPDIEGCA